jgi:hypothetical protein
MEETVVFHAVTASLFAYDLIIEMIRADINDSIPRVMKSEVFKWHGEKLLSRKGVEVFKLSVRWKIVDVE